MKKMMNLAVVFLVVAASVACSEQATESAYEAWAKNSELAPGDKQRVKRSMEIGVRGKSMLMRIEDPEERALALKKWEGQMARSVALLPEGAETVFVKTGLIEEGAK